MAFGGGFTFGGSSAAGFGAASTPAFGASSGGGFSFGTPAAASSAAATTFGAPAASGGLSFGTATTPAFGIGAASSAGTALSLGAPASSAAGGFSLSFGQPASSAASGASFSFGLGASSAAASTGLSFNAASVPAPASGGGFNFSSNPASAASTAAAGTGFSFGTPPASSAATAASASTGGFSFTSTNAASSASLAPAPTLAPSTAAGAASSAPATGAPAANQASSAAAGAAQVAALQPPSEVTGRPVEEIINEWNAELEQRSRSFVKHAEALAKWDSAILANRRAVLELEEELRKVVRGQESLEKKLQMLETHQKGVHEALVGMEGEAERLYREERPLMDDDTRERDRLYERAEKVAALLSHMGEQLKEAIADVNDSTAASLGDSATPLGKAVRVLNNQLQALAATDARIDEVSQHLVNLQPN